MRKISDCGCARILVSDRNVNETNSVTTVGLVRVRVLVIL